MESIHSPVAAAEPAPDPCATNGRQLARGGAPARFRYRTVVDADLGIARATGEGFDADLTETRGEPYDAACADCLVVRPLDDEGFCERCVDGCSLSIAEFSAKYPVSLVPVEHLGVGRICL